MFDYKGFGERLRQARNKAGYSTTQAANKAYISQSVVSRYESGEVTPTIDRVCALAEIYGCSVDWLCGNNGVPVTMSGEVLGKVVEAVKL